MVSVLYFDIRCHTMEFCPLIAVMKDFVFCLNTGDVGEDIVISVSDFEAGQYTFRVSAVDVFEQSVNREFPFTLTGKFFKS